MLIPSTSVVTKDGTAKKVKLWNTTPPQGGFPALVRRTYAITNPDGTQRIVYERVFVIEVSVTNYNVNADFLHQLIIDQVGFIPSDSYLVIRVLAGVYLVSPRYQNRDAYCFHITPAIVGSNNVILENYGIILGGGGNGGDVNGGYARDGGPGSSGILVNHPGKTVEFDNRGTIGGGGGGGGGNRFQQRETAVGGGGGAPFGGGGIVSESGFQQSNGSPATLTSYGNGGSVSVDVGGRGGYWGEQGKTGTGGQQGSGGLPGRAVNVVDGNFSWIYRGDIVGDAP